MLNKEFQSEVQILHLIYHRNKNQHRQAKWWKYFSILHRRCNQLVVLTNSKDHDNSTKIASIAHYLVIKLIPTCYNYFHGVITQGQFVSLGITLIAILARLRSQLLSVCDSSDNQNKENNKVSIQSKEVDIGQIMSRDAVSISKTEQLSKEQPKKEKNKKKKKKSKNAIDEIFNM